MEHALDTALNPNRLDEALVEKYHPEQCMYFSSPSDTVLASGPFADLLNVGVDKLPKQVQQSLRFAKQLGFESPLVMGAIPFFSDNKHQLSVSLNCQHQSAIKVEASRSEQLNHQTHDHPMTARRYHKGVSDALKHIDNQSIDKIVLSRSITVTSQTPFCVRSIVKNLNSNNPKGYTFAVNEINEQRQVESTFLGASPELLIKRVGNRVIANPLAGSKPRSKNERTDKRRANELLKSSKDLHEHAFVVQEIERLLKPFCKTLNVPAAPSVINTPTMWHLSTYIEGELKDSSTTSLELALAIHPTPAVCGYPTSNAAAFIKDIEKHERGLFTGMVGWEDANGNGEWAVAIRCARIAGKEATLYAGAGVVKGSCPDAELAETEAKLNTMKRALGLGESH